MKNQRIVASVILCAHLIQLAIVPVVLASPTGLSSSTPGVNFSGVGTSNVTITSTAMASIVQAHGFNIARNEVASIVQASSASMLIRIGDLNPTSINGQLNAMGHLFLLNPNGILFGPNAQVNAGGLVASSLNLTDANFLKGHYLFQGTGAEGWVKNAGSIHGTSGVYLLAPNVENSGVITSPGGNIVLAAGAQAFLSNRPDGRGFLAEISNLAGQAVNLKDLIADGGNITMAGRVVNQAGLIRADSVRERNGKIELLASEAVTLQDGSRTLARGGDNGVSNGGTIRAIADLSSGTATFQKGAVIDVSGGKNGGNGGFTEVSGVTVRLGGQFLGRALTGFTGGRFLIDPIVSSVGPTDFASFEGSGASNVTFQSPAGSDLVVTGQYDLNAGWNLSGTTGTLTFLAGGNLIFNNANLTNNNSNTRWDYVGTATTGDVLFNNSFITTGFGGNLTFTAPQGNIKLVDSLGNLSVLGTSAAGGNITLTAGLDVVSPSATDTTRLVGSGTFGGIRLDGPGDLTITAGNDVRGGVVSGVLTGPGFVLTNGTATVTAGRNIGGPTMGVNATDPDEYANITFSKGTINLTAQTGNIYLGRLADKGVTDAPDPNALTMTVDPSNSAVLNAQGDIFLNPRPLTALTNSPVNIVSKIYPASFSATTKTGSIFIENDMTLWPSPTGALTLSAGKDVIGVQQTSQIIDTSYGYIFIGFPNVPGGHWQLVKLADALADPTLAPFVATTNLQSVNGIVNPGNSGLPFKTVPTTVPSVTLLEQDPAVFNNKRITNNFANPSQPNFYYKARTTHVIAQPAVPPPVLIEARSGNIQTVTFHLESVPLRKQVTIQAANDIVAMTAKIGVPAGVVATVVAGHNLDMRTAGGTNTATASDLTFNGTGTGRVIVGNLMDLATSTGINFQSSPVLNGAKNQGGFLDISVGGSIKMDSSRIATYNGAPISIHGIGSTPILDGSGNVISANGKPVVVTGTVVQDATGRSEISVNGQIVQFNNGPVIWDGAQPLLDSVSPVTIHLSFAEQGGKLLLDKTGQPYQVLRAEVPLDAGKTLTGFDPVLVNGKIVLMGLDGTVLLAQASQVAKVQSLSGIVTVGTNVSSNPTLRGAPLGISTLGGGGINILATGDINVEKSRISTFFGGDINLTSTNGSINAGSGSRNESTDIPIAQPNDPVTGKKVADLHVNAPASGISTFHPDDPRPLTFIQFNDPEITALRNQAEKEKFFGHQAAADALLAQANALQAQRQPVFSETVLKPYINSLKLGDVNLVAERGSIIIPSAGIQGRTVQIFAPTVDNRGGSIVGNVIIPATVTVSGPPLSITGTGTGAVATPVTPVSGSSASASTSATTAAVSTSAKSTDSVQEAASEGSAKQSEATAKQAASEKSDEKNKKRLMAQSVRMKRGVVIQVDVKPQAQPGN